MEFSKRTQKQVAERLKGNLDYYAKPHPWRTLRFCVSALTIIAGIAAVPAYYYFKGPEYIVNPGPISRAHAQIANDCASCHPNTEQIRRDSHAAGRIVRAEYYVPIDQACAKCHVRYLFHQPNVVPDATRPASTGARDETSSCTSCHREHLTSGKMLPTTDQNCSACHNRADLMAASAKASHGIAPNFFPSGVPRRQGGLLFFYKPHPRDGYTKVFSAFDQGHPPFQIHTEGLKDPDTLQYNHARHERPDIPNTELGTRLDCNYCHKADATGTNFQRVTFEKNCVACHALAFDPNVPPSSSPDDRGLVIPHGEPKRVREYLNDLPRKYLEYAISHEGANAQQAQASMLNAVQRLAESYGVASNNLAQLGPKLEQKVFYNAAHVTTGAGALRRRSEGGGGRGQENTYFPGCAFCHQVSAPVPNVTPTITKAVVFDRWLGDGRFDHAKHQQQSCAECHSSIHQSERTSDINVPTQQSCTQCHNGKPGGVANDCSSCHRYHNDPARRTFKSMPEEGVTVAALEKARPPYREALHQGRLADTR